MREVTSGFVQNRTRVRTQILKDAAILADKAENADTDSAAVPREDRPSWERNTVENGSVLSLESIHLLDGFISHLGRLAEAQAPGAQWQIGQHPNKHYPFRRHPVLAADGRQIFFPGPVATSAREVLTGRRAPAKEEMAQYAEAVIEAHGADFQG